MYYAVSLRVFIAVVVQTCVYISETETEDRQTKIEIGRDFRHKGQFTRLLDRRQAHRTNVSNPVLALNRLSNHSESVSSQKFIKLHAKITTQFEQDKINKMK